MKSPRPGTTSATIEGDQSCLTEPKKRHGCRDLDRRQGPVEPRALCDEMLRVAQNGNAPRLIPGKSPGDVSMLRATADGALARVSVHFRPNGGLVQEAGDHAGYAEALFGTTRPDSDDTTRERHTDLVRKLSPWLEARGLCWCWSFRNDRETCCPSTSARQSFTPERGEAAEVVTQNGEQIHVPR